MSKQVIIIQPIGEVWRSNLVRLCQLKKWPYHSLKDKKFPIKFGELTIEKKKVM